MGRFFAWVDIARTIRSHMSYQLNKYNLYEQYSLEVSSNILPYKEGPTMQISLTYTNPYNPHNYI